MDNPIDLEIEKEKTRRKQYHDWVVIIIVLISAITILTISFFTTKTTFYTNCEVTNIEYDKENCWYNNTEPLELLTNRQYYVFPNTANMSTITEYNLTRRDCVKPHNIKCEISGTTPNTAIINLIERLR